MNRKLSSLVKVGAIAAAAMLTLSSCAANETPNESPEASAPDTSNSDSGSSLTGTLVGAGASAQGVAQDAWIAAFLDVEPGIEITYDPAGSGAGRENFQQGAANFAGSDRAFKIEEIESGDFASCAAGSDIVELPVYISPIAVIFNLEGIDSLNLDADTIAGIFLGEITNWNDPVIAEQNPGVDLPDLGITAVHRADKSGTTGNFTDYLAAASSNWTHGSVEEWPIDGGEAAPQTSGMANAVSGGNGTIGYIDASRAGDLGIVNVKVGDEYVPYSPEAAAAVVDASPLEDGRAATDLAFALDRNTTESGVYPIVLVSYLIGCAEYADPAVAELIKPYFSFAASAEGQELAAAEAGSAPITDDLRSKINAAIDAIK